MITACELAGFFAAHAIWSVSDGGALVPILAYTTGDDERKMERLAQDDVAEAVASGKDRLTSNEMDAIDGVLLFDGRISFDDEDELDAIIIEIRTYFSLDSEAVLAVPYSPASESGDFRVHKPKLVEWKDCDDFDLETAMDAFFKGVDSHDEGSKVWSEALDESK